MESDTPIIYKHYVTFVFCWYDQDALSLYVGYTILKQHCIWTTFTNFTII